MKYSDYFPEQAHVFNSMSTINEIKKPLHNAKELDEFLKKHSRKRASIGGDGNCLFRAFSYVLYLTERRHFQIRTLLVDIIKKNPETFKNYCLPSSVEKHTTIMKQDSTWGSHVEIMAMSLLLRRPIYVALDRSIGNFYWAKCQILDGDKCIIPSHNLAFPPQTFGHFELCHVNGNHYEVPVTFDGFLPTSPPFLGNSSSSSGEDVVIIS